MNTHEPVITTRRLRLYVPSEHDAQDMHAIFADMRVMEWLMRTEPETPQQILERARRHRAFYETIGYCIYLVRRAEDDVLVGDCGVCPAEGVGPQVEIAWRFVPDHWGNGYATEAARAVLDDTFTRTALDEIIAVTRENNVRSQYVMERIGMEFRGLGVYYNHPQRVSVMTRARWREIST